MSNIVPLSGARLPKAAAKYAADTVADLSAGVAASFPVLSFRGSKWRIKYKGEEKLLRTSDDEPISRFTAVIAMSSPNISKIYYKGAYQEGSDDPPDCFSIDGKKPDATATNKQSKTCETCPNNAWGSKITPAGKQTKACSDSRRMVVIPAIGKLHGDEDPADLIDVMKNTAYGGPMLLRVPAASLGGLVDFGNQVAQAGWPYFFVVVRIGFDPDAAFPKLTFKVVRGLTDEEASFVEELRADHAVGRILQSAPELVKEAEKEEEEALARPAPKTQRAKDDDDEDERPAPKARRARDDDDEDERPAPKAKRVRDDEDEDEDEDERPAPKAKRARDEDDEDGQPAPKAKRVRDEDDEDEQPLRKAAAAVEAGASSKRKGATRTKAPKADAGEASEASEDLDSQLADLMADLS